MLNVGYGVVQTLVARLPLVLEVAEVVQLVLDDRAADRRAVLLNADRDDAVRDRILGVEAAALEVAAEETRAAGSCPTS